MVPGCWKTLPRGLFSMRMAEKFTTAYFKVTGHPSNGLVLWDLYVASAALEFMEHWGLDPVSLALEGPSHATGHSSVCIATWPARRLYTANLPSASCVVFDIYCHAAQQLNSSLVASDVF